MLTLYVKCVEKQQEHNEFSSGVNKVSIYFIFAHPGINKEHCHLLLLLHLFLLFHLSIKTPSYLCYLGLQLSDCSGSLLSCGYRLTPPASPTLLQLTQCCAATRIPFLPLVPTPPQIRSKVNQKKRGDGERVGWGLASHVLYFPCLLCQCRVPPPSPSSFSSSSLNRFSCVGSVFKGRNENEGAPKEKVCPFFPRCPGMWMH